MYIRKGGSTILGSPFSYIQFLLFFYAYALHDGFAFSFLTALFRLLSHHIYSINSYLLPFLPATFPLTVAHDTYSCTQFW